ncbi:hypothetical protein B0T24DRAFT_644645 [Lasiosphaeria ovina]|uniref:Uncharacterized protein n=1 Tax=Lasiosphaeria ovina TaxID=92902 RepID=A0AAE0MXY5_9PEZI|nr:hypothetical protein B0T24DRAFT_644645 [Lasiosphaeria ovina]
MAIGNIVDDPELGPLLLFMPPPEDEPMPIHMPPVPPPSPMLLLPVPRSRPLSAMLPPPGLSPPDLGCLELPPLRLGPLIPPAAPLGRAAGLLTNVQLNFFAPCRYGDQEKHEHGDHVRRDQVGHGHAQDDVLGVAETWRAPPGALGREPR